MSKTPERYRGIIFDFNGVLLWDAALQERAWTQFAVEVRGTPFTADEMRDHMHGRPNQAVLEYLIGRRLSATEADRLTQAKERLYRQMCLEWGAEFTLAPGAEAFLDQLRAHAIPRTIATASERINVRFFSEHLGLERWFDVTKIVLDDGTFPGKPAPDMYLRAAHTLGLSPSECVVVEDSVSGLQSAHRAGIGRVYALGARAEHARLTALEGVYQAICQVNDIPLTVFL